MLGKGYRGAEVREALKKYGAVHLSTIGGAGALLSKHIVKAEVIAYEDLGAEAIMRLQVIDFPAIVAYDCYGNSVYEKVKATEECRRQMTDDRSKIRNPKHEIRNGSTCSPS
jgi:fumarate hydratase subunit beta